MCQRFGIGAKADRTKFMKSECKCILKNINRPTHVYCVKCDHWSKSNTYFLHTKFFNTFRFCCRCFTPFVQFSMGLFNFSFCRLILWFIIMIIVIVQLQTKFHSEFITRFPDDHSRSWKYSRFFFLLFDEKKILLNGCVQGYAFIQALNCVGSGTSEHIVSPVSHKQIKSWRAKKSEWNESILSKDALSRPMECFNSFLVSVYVCDVYVFATRKRKLKKRFPLIRQFRVCCASCSVCVSNSTR